MEYRFTFTIEGLGNPEDIEGNMERLLEAFQKVRPDAGPVATGDSEAGTIDITFSLDAEELDAAASEAMKIFAEGWKESPLPGGRAFSVFGQAVVAEAEEKLQLQPA